MAKALILGSFLKDCGFSQIKIVFSQINAAYLQVKLAYLLEYDNNVYENSHFLNKSLMKSPAKTNANNNYISLALQLNAVYSKIMPCYTHFRLVENTIVECKIRGIAL